MSQTNKSQIEEVIQHLRGYQPTELDHEQRDRAQLLRSGAAAPIFTRLDGRVASWPPQAGGQNSWPINNP